ncbi:MAG: tRNA uridine-5-carboxymethylaminomethyl(34) synthesis GTPase MnmE [Anaerotruncus sp.]|nr:tRNA uridine-5-carboxymethylaminomethyl(34) synthesis GTPase MnmE [Anaerotruncus sp.]
MQQDTIAAIATPLGTGGIGVIRISGSQAISVGEKVFDSFHEKRLSLMKGYTCAYGTVHDEQGKIDEVVATVFRAPHSYTGEDTVEFAAHGGVYLLNRLLRACCAAGARLAQAGEFTRRAFLNGKLDLTQAEAIGDLIAAQGRQAAQAAFAAREGALFHKLEGISNRLVSQAAHLAAWIDYPEEEISELDPVALKQELGDCHLQLKQLLASYDTGKMVREGIQVAIVGRPNTGKSTLMNLLTGYQRSIVADLAGTTRDIVSDTIRLGDLILHLSDTAGIRNTDDPIEQAGVQLAEGQLQQAQLVLAVFDGSDLLSEDDQRVIAQCQQLDCIALVNKSDLPQQLQLELLQEAFQDVLVLTAKSTDSLERLQEAITNKLALGNFDSAAAMLANERQRQGVSRAQQELGEAIDALQLGVSYDAVCVCIENAIDALLELTGKRASQEVIDQVFANFCVGK